MLRAQTQPPSSSAPSSSTVVAAANPKTPEEFFARARQLSDLEAAGIPFHLKASFVASGDAEFTGNGTYEEWWQSKESWRKEATLGSYRWVLITNDAKLSLYATSGYVPLRLRQVVDSIPIQFASTADAASEWQVAHQVNSGVDLTVLSTRYFPGGTDPRVRVINAYYFTPEGALRVHQKGEIATFYNNFDPFEDLLIPRRISIASGRKQLVAVTISSLEQIKPDEKTLSDISSLPKNLSKSDFHGSTPSNIVGSRITRQASIDYPQVAKLERIQGTVVIKTAIDELGKVREPYVLSSAGSILDESALDSVRQWHYNPATIEGKPITVETTISVVFALSH